jgi:hypothetical protein
VYDNYFTDKAQQNIAFGPQNTEDVAGEASGV